MMHNTLIIIPAFNEATNIGLIIDSLQKDEIISSFCDILVVNDASSDLTSRIAKRMGVHVVTHVFNLGYGSALQIGYKYAVRRGFKYVIQIDADGQHDISNIRAIYDTLRGKGLAEDEHKPDIVLGSRFLPGSKTFAVSKIKRFVMKYFSILIKLCTGITITDPTSGLQGMSRDAFLYFSKYNVFDTMYPDANTIIQAAKYGLIYKEIPSEMHERISGESMHSGIIKPMKYVVIVTLSIMNIMLRYLIFRKKVIRNESVSIDALIPKNGNLEDVNGKFVSNSNHSGI